MPESSPNAQYILAINCGSSSIKAKLYLLDSRAASGRSPHGRDAPVAELSIKNIAAKGEKVVFKISWKGEFSELGSDVEDEGEPGDQVEYKDLPPQLLKKLEGCSKIQKDKIAYVTHRVVHGGPHKDPIVITREHTEGLKEMDTLSAFAPLHNHSAVLAVRACLDALPKHTSVLLFDTLFHQTLPKEVYTYALPEADQPTPVPIRKYGFHGLSYMSILSSMAKKLDKPEKHVSIVVAHLGSGGSACCIRNGESVDTTMGLTPLEGLVGGTRSGSVDPTAVFHIVKDCSADAGLDGMKVTKAEATLNKKSGLQALAGTSNFGTITQNMLDASSDEHARSSLAYEVYVDRLMGFLVAYLAKLFSTLPGGIGAVDGLVFSGGIGEKSDHLRGDVVGRLGWLGAQIDDARNKAASEGDEEVAEISKEGSKLRAWTVQTDEEGVCYRLCREHMKV